MAIVINLVHSDQINDKTFMWKTYKFIILLQKQIHFYLTPHWVYV